MPFVTQEKRKILDADPSKADCPGDACYLIYKEMMKEWRQSPRWTTADVIFNSINDNQFIAKHLCNGNRLGYSTWARAEALAWQVFFAKVVMKYEDVQEEKNGQIEN